MVTLLASCGVAAATLALPLSARATIVPPAPGEILVCDVSSGNGLAVFNPLTGGVRSISSGGLISSPLSVAIESPTSALVSDFNSKAIVRVNLATGAQSSVSSGGYLNHPDGVVMGNDGLLYVTDLVLNEVVAINPASGAQRLVAAGNLLNRPDFLLPVGADSVLVADEGAGRLVWVRISTGTQTVAASGGLIVRPEGMALDGSGNVTVVDLGSNTLLTVNLATQAQHAITTGFQDVPVGLVIDLAGDAIVGNYDYTPNSFTRVDLTSGAKTVYSTPPVWAFGMVLYGGAHVAPPAPAQLTASDDQPDGVHLTWTSAPGATAYRVFRDSIVVADVLAPDTTALDVPPVGTYHYCVKSENLTGSSALTCDSGTRRPYRQAAAIQFVKDVPNDQGGKVALAWLASELDVVPHDPITGYRVWRRLPVQSAMRQAANATAATLRAGVRAITTSTQVTYWEALATYPSAGMAGYGAVVATTQDSLPNGNPYTAFFVSALTSDPGVFYDSPIDSGYSVDNLAPPPPAALHGTASSTAVTLHWLPSPAPDFATFRVYRGASASFPTDHAHLIATRADTVVVDPGVSGSWYKVTAVDTHGNESTPATLAPTEVPTSTLVSEIDAFRETGGVRVHIALAAAGTGSTAVLYRGTTTSFGDAGAVSASPTTVAADGLDLWDRAPLASDAAAWYWVQIVDPANEVFVAGPVSPGPGVAPAITALASPEPNPSVNGATLRFAIGSDVTHGGTAAIRLAVYDVRGRAVRTLVSEARGAANYTIAWDAKDDAGRAVAAGVYYLRLVAGSKRATTKLVIAR